MIITTGKPSVMGSIKLRLLIGLFVSSRASSARKKERLRNHQHNYGLVNPLAVAVKIE